MTIWIDLTNTFSLGNNNQNKVQNFELELIKSLSNIDSSIRFSIYKQNGFEEISRKDLSWALKDDNSKKNYSEEESFQKTFYENYKSLKDAKDFSESRLVRMGEAIKLMISLFPRPASKWIYYLARLVYKPLRKLSIYRANYIANKKFLEAKTVKNDILIHPFKDGDVFFSYDSVNVDKENILSKIKMNIPNLKLVYFVSDAAISKKELQHLFIDRHNSFSKHMEWISNNCDFVLYAGKLTQQDMENYLIKKEMRVPNGVGVELGSNKKKATSIEDYNQLSKKIGLNEPYLLSVGTIEPRKNYKTLYQAYVLLAEKYPEKEIPFLVIVGEDGGDKDLIETIKSHPITKKKIIITQVTKEELDILYQNCMLVLLPSLYESCSAVVTEALSYGKTCICSNAVFLQEITKEEAFFVETTNPWKWAEKIMELIEDKLELDKKEEFIQKNWDFKTWEESAQTIYDKLKAIALVKNNGKTNLYYDMTLVWNSSFVDAPVSGILRTQLILARYLSRIYPNIKFCAFTPNKYYELDKVMLSNILGMDAVDISFYNDKPKIRASVANQEKNNTHYNKVILKRSFWLMLSILPFNLQSKITKVVKRKFNRESFSNMENDIVSLPFKKGDIVFSAGAGYTKEIYKNLLQEHNNEKYYFVQLIYDYTPILVPQTHKKETIEHYIPFLKYSSELADVIFFGGKTAMRDGLKYQKENQQKICPAYAMKFGSNIIGKNPSKKRTKEVLDYYQISDNFILTVGSIEARKNHETLYQAYLKLIQQENTSIPQLVICGYPGWKTKDFISQLDNDERVRGKIIHGTFSDEELDILYRNCNFTVLPSLYEGWSLTLPESLNYGKFCIASDVDPLREIGQDFIDYVHPYDSDGWAEKILYYSDNFDKLKEKEEKIHTAWHTITWKECAENTANALDQLAKYGPQSFATTMEE